MAGARTIRIGEDSYVLVATIDEGQNLWFYAGHAIAVEKMGHAARLDGVRLPG